MKRFPPQPLFLRMKITAGGDLAAAERRSRYSGHISRCQLRNVRACRGEALGQRFDKLMAPDPLLREDGDQLQKEEKKKKNAKLCRDKSG